MTTPHDQWARSKGGQWHWFGSPVLGERCVARCGHTSAPLVRIDTNGPSPTAKSTCQKCADIESDSFDKQEDADS